MLLTFTSDLRALPPPPSPPLPAHPALGCSAIPSPTAVCTAQPCTQPCSHPAPSPAHIQHPVLHPALLSVHQPTLHPDLTQSCTHPAPRTAPTLHTSCTELAVRPAHRGTGGCGRGAGCTGAVLPSAGEQTQVSGTPLHPMAAPPPRGQQGWDGASPQPGIACASVSPCAPGGTESQAGLPGRRMGGGGGQERAKRQSWLLASVRGGGAPGASPTPPAPGCPPTPGGESRAGGLFHRLPSAGLPEQRLGNCADTSKTGQA